MNKAPDTLRQKANCEACGTKPKYVDPNGMQHAYCGRSCARVGVGKAASECSLRGCSNLETAACNGFCSEDHAKKGGVVPLPPASLSPKETRARNYSSAPRPTLTACLDVVQLSENPGSGTVWREFVREWNSMWLSQQGSAFVEKLYEISYPAKISEAQDNYRRDIEATTGKPRILRTFHASQCICDMGTKGPMLCEWKSCGICNVVGSAFRGVAFGVPYNTGRQGKGLYSSRNPASADRFATSCLSSPYRVMIACDVVLPQQLEKSTSVIAGSRIVVRVPEAIVPRFIVMYTMET